ncbi:MAG: hypothetical protein WBE13_06930 [Candidatus Acidiferrum sp.]
MSVSQPREKTEFAAADALDTRWSPNWQAKAMHSSCTQHAFAAQSPPVRHTVRIDRPRSRALGTHAAGDLTD